jgi:hypothetical protein
MFNTISQTKSTARNLSAIVVASLLLLLATSARAEDGVRYHASPIGSKVRIEGSSNIHDWTMDGQIIAGYLESPVALDPAQAGLPGVTGGKLNARAEVSIPVTAMKSGTTGMDEVMQDALNEKTCPRITYHLTEMTLKEPHAANTPLEFNTKGELAVAGVTNAITMPVRIESAEKSKLKLIGSIPLKMTSFKVKPPVKLGVFKTVDDIKISFEWTISPPAKTTAAKP